jgi:hypothetical protein
LACFFLFFLAGFFLLFFRFFTAILLLPLLVERMFWISRKSVDSYLGIVATTLFLFFCALMAISAKRLQISKPEQFVTVFVWHDMIGYFSGCDPAFLQTLRTQWMLTKLLA